MTKYKELRCQLMASGRRVGDQYVLTMQDGSVRCIPVDMVRGSALIGPNVRIMPCKKACYCGPDANGMCGLRKKWQPSVACRGQFVVFRKHFLRSDGSKLASIAYKNSNEIVSLENNTAILAGGDMIDDLNTKLVGYVKPMVGKYLIPCGKVCKHQGPDCIRYPKRGTPCEKQYMYVLTKIRTKAGGINEHNR